MNKSNYFRINITKKFVEMTIANKIYIISKHSYLHSTILYYDETVRQWFPSIYNDTKNNINLNYSEQ